MPAKLLKIHQIQSKIYPCPIHGNKPLAEIYDRFTTIYDNSRHHNPFALVGAFSFQNTFLLHCSNMPLNRSACNAELRGNLFDGNGIVRYNQSQYLILEGSQIIHHRRLCQCRIEILLCYSLLQQYTISIGIPLFLIVSSTPSNKRGTDIANLFFALLHAT